MFYKNTDWTKYKAFVDDREISPQILYEDDNMLELCAFTGNLCFRTTIEKTDPPTGDHADFENNYRSISNNELKNITQIYAESKNVSGSFNPITHDSNRHMNIHIRKDYSSIDEIVLL